MLTIARTLGESPEGKSLFGSAKAISIRVRVSGSLCSRRTMLSLFAMDLRTYIDQKRGLAADIARKLDISPVLVSQWAAMQRNVPAERCPSIERVTDGKVRCEELRPDVDWDYLRGTERKIV